MSLNPEAMLKTHKDVIRRKFAEAAVSVDWETLALAILRSGPSSPIAGPANSWISTVNPRVLPQKPEHDGVVIDRYSEEGQEYLRSAWTRAQTESVANPRPYGMLSDYSARAQTDVSSLEPSKVREIWYRQISQIEDVRKILARKRGEQTE